MYDINLDEGDEELVKKLAKEISKYERDCFKKAKLSSPTEVKKMIEDACKLKY